MKSYHVVILVVVFLFIRSTKAQTDEPETNYFNDTTLPEDWSYCYEFTWFGPSYDNSSMYNNTCDEYLDESRATNIPCSPPIVISYNGTPPDIDYLWENHKASVLCKRASGEVCAKYSYIYNGQVNNASYMCTKVQSVGEGPVLSGCYTQKFEGYEMELCVCESNPGVFKPCNSQATLTIYLTVLFIGQFLFMFIR